MAFQETIMPRIFCAALLAAAALVRPASAQNADVAKKVEALGKISSATSPTFSPDSRRMAYLSNESGSPQIWVRDLSTGAARQVTNLVDPVGSVFWSPASDRLAYSVLPGGGLNTQIWVINADGSGAVRLTPGGKENNGLSGWTRDGTRLMVDSNKDHPAARDPALIDVATGKWTMLAADKGLNSLSDVRADRAVLGRLIGRGDVNGYLIELRTGKEALLTPHEGKAETDWGELSPDGRTVYVISNVGRDSQAFGTIKVGADAKPSPIRYFAERDDAVAEGAVLSDDGSTAALVWNVGGRSELAWLDIASRRVRPGPKLPFDLAFPAEFSADGRTLAVVGAGADRTTDIYLIDIGSGAIVQTTQSRHDGVNLAELVRPELIAYKAHDGVPLSGWLYKPRGATGPMPVVFIYHGGPEGQARPTMSADAQALAASGIAVFAPNVRGSSGFGKAFMAMDDGAKRVGAVRDIKATTDALVARGIADPKRVGIMGGSYGGYMVMAAVTEFPDMFAAAADLYGIVNFESFFRESEPWMAAISTTEYGDPATQLDVLQALSPIHKLDRVKTPLFVLHGANDTNVPVVEAEQIVAAMKTRGVPVRYTLFPDEGHGWRKTPNRVRSTTEIVGFFVDHLKPTAP
ncbi:MAG TPA: S9 family peptidase [Sphingomicrobium sp.]|nr:S9 family peptidase [Sphingomicrobium sp.]